MMDVRAVLIVPEQESVINVKTVGGPTVILLVTNVLMVVARLVPLMLLVLLSVLPAWMDMSSSTSNVSHVLLLPIVALVLPRILEHAPLVPLTISCQVPPVLPVLMVSTPLLVLLPAQLVLILVVLTVLLEHSNVPTVLLTTISTPPKTIVLLVEIISTLLRAHLTIVPLVLTISARPALTMSALSVSLEPI